MSIRNWQTLPYQIEVLLKIAPKRVLDANIEFGRWGMLAREFCDGWMGRASPQEWSVYIEGIAATEAGDGEIAGLFYNRIHHGAATQVVPGLPGEWDILILDGVLERSPRPAGEHLLAWGLEHCAYVLVNVPLGSEWPLSETYASSADWLPGLWSADDFDRLHKVRQARYLDHTGRPFGFFVLSQHDEKNLKTVLFSMAPAPAVEEGRESGSTALYIQALERRNNTLEQRNEILDRYNQDLRRYNQQANQELDAIKNSRTFQLIERVRQSAFKKVVMKAARPVIRRLRGAAAQPVSSGAPARKAAPPPVELPSRSLEFSAEERAWLEAFRAHPGPVSINNPSWRGILASARQLFEHIFLLPDELDEDTAQRYARLFCEAQPPSVVIQGMPQSYFHLITALHRLAPGLPILLIWHGNFLQLRQDYDWDSLRLVKMLAEEGAIAKVGFVKHGAAEVMRKAGLNSAFVTNLVRRIPQASSQPLPGGPHIGVWGEPDYGWNKLPYAALGAISQLPEADTRVINVSERAREFGEWFHLKAEYHTQALPNAQVMETLPRMHVNLNVSLAECAPMLPLESLSQGAPCLLGPTSHYFLDHEYLHSRLVVPYPDHPLTIARYIRQALDERDEIIRAYAAYAPGYNQRAIQLLSDFLEYPLGAAA